MPDSIIPSGVVSAVQSVIATATTTAKVPSKIWLYVVGGIILIALILGAAGTCVYKKTTETYSQQITTLTKQITDTKTQLDQVIQQKSDLEKSVASSSIILKTLAIVDGKAALDGTGKAIYDYKYVKTVDSNMNLSKGLTIATADTTNTNTNTTTSTTSLTKSSKVSQQGQPVNGVAYLSTGTGIFTGKIGDLSIGVQHAILFDVWLGAQAGVNDLTNIPGSFYTKVSIGAGIP